MAWIDDKLTFNELDFNLFKQTPMEKRELIDILSHTTDLVGSRCVMLECLCRNEMKNSLWFYLPGEYNNVIFNSPFPGQYEGIQVPGQYGGWHNQETP